MAAALSLLQAGFDVHVYERAAAVSEVGAGIQVSPNASRILHRLGLADELARMGVRPLAWHQRRWDDGRTLLRARPRRRRRRGLRLPALPDAPRRSAGRARRRAAARAPARRPPASPASSTTATASRRRSRTARRSRSTCSSAPTASTRPSARCCSARRTRVFTGCAAYRGLVPAERLRHLDLEVTAQIWMGPGPHFVHYFVARQAARQLRRGRRAGQLDARVVDRPRRPGRRDRRLRGLASAAARDPGRRRRDVHLGPVRPAAAGALVARVG